MVICGQGDSPRRDERCRMRNRDIFVMSGRARIDLGKESATRLATVVRLVVIGWVQVIVMIDVLTSNEMPSELSKLDLGLGGGLSALVAAYRTHMKHARSVWVCILVARERLAVRKLPMGWAIATKLLG